MKDLFSLSEKAAFYILAIGLVVFLVWVIFTAGYGTGVSEATREAREARECDCGEVKPCAFAPGIVGIRECRRFDNRWARCEPDPKYRIEENAWLPSVAP
jgi:hypothetical protein